MRVIDGVIRKSLKDAVNFYGGLLGVSHRLGVSHSTVVFWLSGKTKHINSDLWRGKVYSLLAPFLKKNLPDIAEDEIFMRYFDSLPSVCGEKVSLEIPVICDGYLLNYEPVIESVGSYIASCSSRKTRFLGEYGKRYFAVSFDTSESLLFDLPGVLLVCVDGERVKSGDLVVVRLSGVNHLCLKSFLCNDQTVSLSSFCGENEDCITWDLRKEKHLIEWMFPVVWINMKCRCS